MKGPAYPAGHYAATRVHPHLHRLNQTSTLPDSGTIETIIDAAFWASLRREEGMSPMLSLAYVTPDSVTDSLRFQTALALEPQMLTQVAPAVERPGIHLGVWRDSDGELRVWGATRLLPPYCFVLEVIAPGLLVIKQSPADDSGKFVNVAVLEGDNVKIVDQLASRIPDCPDLLTSLLGFSSPQARMESVNTLIQLAVSMRAHGRGGSLLVVPADSEAWRESMVQPIRYAVSPAFSVLAELMKSDPSERPRRWWQDAYRRVVDGIAGLTAVDGATVMTDRYELLAFGAKIIRRPGSPQVSRVMVTEPIEGSTAEVMEPALLGGTRHLSAAQFEQDQRDSIALVASQDGRFTIFAWSPCESMVHAHRIETLLL